MAQTRLIELVLLLLLENLPDRVRRLVGGVALIIYRARRQQVKPASQRVLPPFLLVTQNRAVVHIGSCVVAMSSHMVLDQKARNIAIRTAAISVDVVTHLDKILLVNVPLFVDVLLLLLLVLVAVVQRNHPLAHDSLRARLHGECALRQRLGVAVQNGQVVVGGAVAPGQVLIVAEVEGLVAVLLAVLFCCRVGHAHAVVAAVARVHAGGRLRRLEHRGLVVEVAAGACGLGLGGWRAGGDHDAGIVLLEQVHLNLRGLVDRRRCAYLTSVNLNIKTGGLIGI